LFNDLSENILVKSITENDKLDLHWEVSI